MSEIGPKPKEDIISKMVVPKRPRVPYYLRNLVRSEIGVVMKDMIVNIALLGQLLVIRVGKKVITNFYKSVHEVKSLTEDQVLFLGEVNVGSNDSWTADIKVSGHNTQFKVDTGHLFVC